MAQFHIRDFPDELVPTVDELARAATKSREAWLRDLVIDATKQPVIRERYAYRFYNDDDSARGVVKRHSDHLNGTVCTYAELSQSLARICAQAEDFVRRNEVGDREKAVALLSKHFDHVFEIPV